MGEGNQAIQLLEACTQEQALRLGHDTIFLYFRWFKLPPMNMVFHHCIQDAQQLSDTGGYSDFFMFSILTKSLVKSLNGFVEPHSHYSCHIQSSSYA